MDALVSEYLTRLQSVQARYGEYFNNFSVTVAWDEYYENYLRCTFTNDNGQYNVNFIDCIDKEDFEIRYRQLLSDVSGLTGQENDR